MTKQEQIYEMAVIGCTRVPQAHTAEECAKCDFKQGQCNAYRHAEALYNAGYRRAVTFTYDVIKMIQRHAVKEFVDELRNKCSEVKGYHYSFGNISGVIEELLEEYKND